MEEPHIPDDVQPSPVQKNVGQEGEIMIERKVVDIRPARVGVPGRDKAEEIKYWLQKIPGKGYFEEENDPVDNNQSPGNGRESRAGNSVF